MKQIALWRSTLVTESGAVYFPDSAVGAESTVVDPHSATRILSSSRRE